MVFIFLILILFFFFPAKIFAQNYEPRIFVQYHLWNSKEDPIPWGGKWNFWSQTSLGMEVIGGVDPTHFITPWRRITVSRLGLPITGPYSSQVDLGVVEYHFILAKEAGIDGMFASVYNGGWWPIFRKHLDIASRVGIKIAPEFYHGVVIDKPSNPEPYRQFPKQENGCKIFRNWQIDEMVYGIKNYKDNQAFLRIDGKPAVWIANGRLCSGSNPNISGSCGQKWRDWFPQTDCPAPEVVYTRGSVSELREVLMEVENRVGEPIYVIITNGELIDYYNQSFATISQIKKITTVENISVFNNLFGYDNQISVNLNQNDSLRYKNEYQSRINYSKSVAGDKFSLHIYPAFDERGVFPTNAYRGSGINKPRAVITRDGNGMYEKNDGFLKAALDIARENGLWVFLESWNDWAEQTQLEPGFAFNNFIYHRDYFSPLKKVAQFKGINNPNFFFPDPSLLDPPLIKYCRHKEFEGGRVKLKGRFGFSQGASQTNGVSFSVSYIDDYVSRVDPSWQGSTTWKPFLIESKNYNGSLKNFEVDITPILDTPAIVFGIESNGDPQFDQVYFTEFKLDWYGREVDLLDGEKLSLFNWHSQKGNVVWPSEGQDGTATIKTNVVLEDRQTYSKALYLHPNFNVSGNTFIHAGINWLKFEPHIPQCCSGIQGDADCNFKINIEDFLVFLSNYLVLTNQRQNRGDFSYDGKTNSYDFGIWLKNWLENKSAE